MTPLEWRIATSPSGQIKEIKVAGDPLPVKIILAQIMVVQDLAVIVQ